MMSIQKFSEKMDKDGYVIFENFVRKELIDSMIEELEHASLVLAEIQYKNGIANSTNTVHHLVANPKWTSFISFLEYLGLISTYMETYFGGKFILNSFGGNILRSGSSYANNIHRDQRSFSNDLPLMLNTIVMLDDFTENNGATWILPCGHLWKEKPCCEVFDKIAIQTIAPAGSMLMFNSNMWHAAGENRTNKPRRSVTPMFCKPFIKPQFDYPRALGYDKGHEYSDWLCQLLGYNARVPASFSEWYQRPEKRMYRSDQG